MKERIYTMADLEIKENSHELKSKETEPCSRKNRNKMKIATQILMKLQLL